MTEIKLIKRYPNSRTEDITDAYMRGWNDALDAVQNGKFHIADTPQTEEKHAICNGCVYCDLPNAFHPCASCVDFSKYVGEESGDTPQTDCGWK